MPPNDPNHTNAAGGKVGSTTTTKTAATKTSTTNTKMSNSTQSGGVSSASKAATSSNKPSSTSKAAESSNKGSTGARGPTGNQGQTAVTGSKGATTSGFGKNTTSGKQVSQASSSNKGAPTSVSMPNVKTSNPGAGRPMGDAKSATWADVNLRGPTGPQGQPKTGVTPYQSAYTAAQVERFNNPTVAAKYDDAQLASYLDTFAKAVPGESYYDKYGTAPFNDVARTGLNQVRAGVSPQKMLAGMDTTGMRPATVGMQNPSRTSMGMQPQNSPLHQLAANSILDAALGLGGTPGLENATHFGTPGQMTEGVTKIGNANGMDYGQDPAYKARIESRNSKAAETLNKLRSEGFVDNSYSNVSGGVSEVARQKIQDRMPDGSPLTKMEGPLGMGAYDRVAQEAVVQAPGKMQDRVLQEVSGQPYNMSAPKNVGGMSFTPDVALQRAQGQPYSMESPQRTGGMSYTPGIDRVEDIFSGANSAYALPDEIPGFADQGRRLNVPGSWQRADLSDMPNLPAQGQPYAAFNQPRNVGGMSFTPGLPRATQVSEARPPQAAPNSAWVTQSSGGIVNLAQGKQFGDRIITDASGKSWSVSPAMQEDPRLTDAFSRYENNAVFTPGESRLPGIGSSINWSPAQASGTPSMGIGDSVTQAAEEQFNGIPIVNNPQRDNTLYAGGRLADWMVPDYIQNRGDYSSSNFSRQAESSNKPPANYNLFGKGGEGILSLLSQVTGGISTGPRTPTTPTPPAQPLGQWSWQENPMGGYWPVNVFGYY